MARAPGWGPTEMGDLAGTTMVVTGANSGIGYATALELARHGAHVVLACRNPDKARRANDLIIESVPDASVEVLALDLSDLLSVREAAIRFNGRHDRLDVLVNNAGLMGSPHRITADGLELQFATNHFGHFAFTGLVLDRLLSTPRSRVVTVSSMGHRMGRFHPADLTGDGSQNRWITYGNTKLANLLFTYELQRRLAAAGAPTMALAAHPGWARSNLAANGPTMGGSAWRAKAGRLAVHLGQSSLGGALPTLYAATASGLHGGEYFGPRGLAQQHGPPVQVTSSKASHSIEDAAALWAASEELTGVTFSFVAPETLARP